MKLAVLVLEGCMHSAVAGLVDLMALADHVARGRGGGTRFELLRVSLDGKPVRGAGGARCEVDAAAGPRLAADAVLVPGLMPSPAPAAERLARYAPARAWLRAQHATGKVIGASCGGVFLLAEAGLLDHRQATTTWWLQSELQRRYPKVRLARDAVLTESDRIVCAAGPMSWVDLLLRLIAMVDGPEAARLCADYAVLDTAQRTQAAYRPAGYLLRQDPLLVKADMLVRCAGEAPMTVRGLAAELALSERTLHRRFMALTGEAPQVFIQRRRIDVARTLLETTKQTVRSVAHAVGYEDESSFRKAFRTLTTMSPQAYRARSAGWR